MTNSNKIKRIIFNPKDKVQALIGFIVAESLDGEEWRELKGYDGYFISSKGRVLSLKDNIPELKIQTEINGYLYIHLNDGLKRVNKLVATTFLPNPDNLPIAHHKNHIKTENRVENLAWTTYSENTKMYYEYKKSLENKEENKENEEVFTGLKTTEL